MRNFLTAMTFLLLASTAAAQEYSLHWISAPMPDSTSQLWFRKQIVTGRHPKKVYVSISTTGYADLYVNGRNASRFIMTPYREPYSTYTATATYDISRFVHSDTITLAVWYSPSYPHITDRQISVICYGSYDDGTKFAHFSDRSWLCRQSNTRLNGKGGETIDGRQDSKSWKSGSLMSSALWTGCVNVPTKDEDWAVPCGHKVTAIGEVMGYRYFDIEKGTVTYDFGNGFYGWLRITLRNAKRGERVYFGNMEYICNGKLDEQACMRFTTEYIRKPVVCGNRLFRPSHITNVEGINLIIR